MPGGGGRGRERDQRFLLLVPALREEQVHAPRPLPPGKRPFARRHAQAQPGTQGLMLASDPGTQGLMLASDPGTQWGLALFSVW